jgi:hypothetical protein
MTIVKSAADTVDGDGRIEVFLASDRKKETMRVKPANLRLEKHAAAEAHAAAVGHTVHVTSLSNSVRDCLSHALTLCNNFTRYTASCAGSSTSTPTLASPLSAKRRTSCTRQPHQNTSTHPARNCMKSWRKTRPRRRCSRPFLGNRALRNSAALSRWRFWSTLG